MKLSKKKGYRIIKGKPCGERSPYWDWLEGHSRYGAAPQEPIDANPDMLPESAHMFASNLDDNDQARLDAIINAWHSLSTRERQAIEWYGHEGKTLEQTAKIIGISVASLRNYLARASRKIQREYKMLQE